MQLRCCSSPGYRMLAKSLSSSYDAAEGRPFSDKPSAEPLLSLTGYGELASGYESSPTVVRMKRKAVIEISNLSM